jgi:K+-transporting ATPase ATPase A chain
MHSYDYALILGFFALVLLPAPWLGRFYYKVMEGQRTWLSPLLAPVERGCYRLAGVDPLLEQSWQRYTLALLAFNLAGFVLLFAILMLQGYLPLNPQGLPGQEWSLAFNTAVSFVTNTNWQAYSGEASLSYFSQMVGLTVQNFVSAATGLAVLVALCRGIARRSAATLGNFWVDMTRATLYGLLPLCLLLALLLVWQGVPQTFSAYVSALTLQGGDQAIPMGPVASQLAIKQLGTNCAGVHLRPLREGPAPKPRHHWLHAGAFHAGWRAVVIQRATAQPGAARADDRAGGTARRQGKPLWHHRHSALGGDHDRGFEWLGERHA